MVNINFLVWEDSTIVWDTLISMANWTFLNTYYFASVPFIQSANIGTNDYAWEEGLIRIIQR